ncbi:MAG: hypothetical protein LBM75_00715 [Myxococcales bacterium]|nr:hypothetical protein [Myxococcales bacterium]
MIYQETLRILRHLSLPEIAEMDVLQALKAAQCASPLDTAYWATQEAGLSRQESIYRAAAVFLNFATANLADDLSDGDCSYLSQAKIPGVQFILQNLVFHCLMRSSIEHETLRMITEDLLAMGAGQQIEVSTEQWTLQRACEVGEAISGRQYAAYFQILWGDTALGAHARDWGQRFGNASHISIDLQTNDERLHSLPNEDIRKLLNWALAGIEEFKTSEIELLKVLWNNISAPMIEWLEKSEAEA